MNEPSFSLGIEEEYLLVDARTLALAEAPEALMASLRDVLGEQVSPEFLRCQVEVGTRKCADIPAARADLSALRRTVAEHAARHGLAPIAASCHPAADWRDQHVTDKPRYAEHERNMRVVAKRMLVSGMHVHVGLDDDELRIDLMSQISYFVPHLLALSASSPFWQGEDTGLASYRLSVFDSMPRSGLPPQIGSWPEYRRALALLARTGEIADGSYVWWDVRPAELYPTLEVRICDLCPRLDHAISLAALIQALMRMLWRLRRSNQRWRMYEPFLIAENRWRAQRYGMAEGLIDFGRGEVLPFAQIIDELLELVAADTAALGTDADVQAVRAIQTDGTGADRMRAAHRTALEGGADAAEALTAVTRMLVAEFLPAD